MKIQAYVSGVIFSLIALLLIYFVYTKIYSGTTNIADSEMCKQSVMLNANMRFNEINPNTDIKCPMLTITEDSTDKNVVFATLADSMSDTWGEFLKGEREVFDVSKNDFCVIRRIVEFKNPQTYAGFTDYLLTHNPSGVSQSYFSYFTGVDVKEGDVKLTDDWSKNDVIDTSIPYAEVFVMAKTTHWSKLKSSLVGGGIGTFLGSTLSAMAVIFTDGAGATVVTTIAPVFTGGTAALGAFVGFLFGHKTDADWQAGIILIQYTKENLNSLNCTKLPVAVTANQK